MNRLITGLSGGTYSMHLTKQLRLALDEVWMRTDTLLGSLSDILESPEV